MKKKSKSNLVIIAVILLVALFFSVYSLILNVKKTYAYSYSNYQTTYEYNVNAKSQRRTSFFWWRIRGHN